MQKASRTIERLNTEARRLFRVMEKCRAGRREMSDVVPIATAVKTAAHEFLRSQPDATEEIRGVIWSIGHAASLAAHCRDAAGYVDLRLQLKDGFEKLDGLCAPAAPPVPDPFVPTPIQADILKALNGRALKVEALADAIGCETSRLYKPGGIHELRARGFVKHKRSVGYYCSDAPPRAAARDIPGKN